MATIRRALALTLCLLVVSGFVPALQENEPAQVLECVAGRNQGLLYLNGRHDLTPEQVEEFYAIEGYGDLWIGYANGGWAVPLDAVYVGRLYLWSDDSDRAMVWFFVAESTPEWTYWFVFDTLKPTADSNGQHWGLHPCGAFRVWSG